MLPNYQPEHGPELLHTARMEGNSPSRNHNKPKSRRIVPTDFISLDQATNYLNAHFMAEAMGAVLNTHLIINLNSAPGFDGASVKQQRAFMTELMRAIRAWVERRTGNYCHWVWFLENDAQKGLHLHVHLPLHKTHHDGLRDFLKHHRDLNGPVYRAPVWTSGGEDQPTPEQMTSKRKYLLKLLEPDGIAPNGRPAVPALRTITEPGLPIEGCRCRVSNSLNRKARAAARWREITDLSELDTRLPIEPGTNWWEVFRRRTKRQGMEARHVA